MISDRRLAEILDQASIRQAEGYLIAVIAPAEAIELVEEILAMRRRLGGVSLLGDAGGGVL